MASLSKKALGLIDQMKLNNKELEGDHMGDSLNFEQSTVLKKLAGLAKDKEQRVLLGENKDVREAVDWMWWFADMNIRASDRYFEISATWEFVCGTARLTGNLAAGCPSNQKWIAEKCEPAMRSILHYTTSWYYMEGNEDNILPRLIAQCLTNVVTGNEETSKQIWTTYMALPEKDNIVTRLLQHKHPQTVNVALVFILNSLSTGQGQSLAMAKGIGGRAICCSMLEMGARASEEEQEEDTFQYIYSILVKLFENGALAPLYKQLRSADATISPHQITLLKFLDGYTHSDLTTFDQNSSISAFLSSTLPALLQTTKQCITANPNSEAEFVPDENLPQVSAATVLVSQMLSNVLMAEQTAWEKSNDKEIPGRPVLNDLRNPSSSFVELIIDVLRRLDQMIPRIQFGKAKPVVNGANTPSDDKASLPASRFQYQKRDLVRLLGILIHDDPSVQTRVREAGGVQLILGLCAIDENNPYIREHALFALRNLLHKNPKNQQIVQEMAPMGKIDENGMLTGI